MRLIITIILSLLVGFIPAAFAESDFLHRNDVQSFIEHMVQKHQFKRDSLEALFEQVKARPQVIRHIKKPLEKEPWKLYQLLFVNEWRIKHGVEFWDKYQDVLTKAEKVYGVPASIIVATIGIETKYGERTGEYRVIDSLSNIAFSDSPRAYFFCKELEQFLLLCREQNLNPTSIMGSYAGAIGQPQFMPSSYRYYAVNFSGSGKTDLMNDEVDVIGSVANYYQKHGWIKNAYVAEPAVSAGDSFEALLEVNRPNQAYHLDELKNYGITPKRRLNDKDEWVKLIALDSRISKEYWLGFRNFDVIKRYNPSDLYAMAVYQLSNYITQSRQSSPKG